MATPKTHVTKDSVAGFIAKLQEPRKGEAKTVLKMIQSITGKRGELWSNGMIGFGKYHFKSERSSQEADWPLTAFSARKSNITVYVMGSLTAVTKYNSLLKKLGPHRSSGGGCIYITNLSKIDLSILKKIIVASYGDMKKRYK
jgi:hypothetical protein